MTRASQPTPPAAPTKLLYAGPAGKVWADGLELYGLRASGINVMGLMPGSPSHQPSAEEMAAVSSAAQSAYGPLRPWMVVVGALLVFLALTLLGVPAWAKVLAGVVMTALLVALPAYRQYQAFQGLFGSHDELTLVLSDTPTQAVSSVVEVGPETPRQELSAARQPVAVVLRGLPVAERIKLAGAVTRHTAMRQMGQRRKG